MLESRPFVGAVSQTSCGRAGFTVRSFMRAFPRLEFFSSGSEILFLICTVNASKTNVEQEQKTAKIALPEKQTSENESNKDGDRPQHFEHCGLHEIMVDLMIP